MSAEDPWTAVTGWIDRAGDRARVLPEDTARAKEVGSSLGLSPSSILHAMAGHVGGMLVDDGWVRVLGGGATDVIADLASWNGLGVRPVLGRTPERFFVAFDVLGGVFALASDRSVHYFAPDSLRWESLNTGYTGWLEWLLSRPDGLESFYADERWPSWRTDVRPLRFDEALHASPPRWTREGKGAAVSRRAMSAREVVGVAFDTARQLDETDHAR